MSADELVRNMWDEGAVGITDQNKPLTAEEVLAAWKVAESRCYAVGRYEVAIPWKDDEPPLHCNRTTAEDRLYSLEKHLQRRPDVAEKYCQPNGGLIQNLVKLFWKLKRWREEFLSTPKTQKKWRGAKDNLKVGGVVLVVDKNAPCGQ
ncbi:hypothetical protein P5673_009433 [Acropora cervicornis]|uniref:DUF5641 domain-containing protein n=1 Tax=Acropora cervicornis TaxID=6130 RepID=A0AAD9QSV0_ACRCE|nr:hypothetical protein P5673_009433 [Acropora cervicornis]